MRHNFIAFHIHIVFSTKHRARVLTKPIRERLWQYMGGVAREKGMSPLAIGGYDDHCHALVALPTSMEVAKAVQYLKGGSSRWLSAQFPELKDFEWQKGYGAFTVSISHIPATVIYIHNQEKHHAQQPFEIEFMAILRKNGVSFDPATLFDDDDERPTD